MMLYIYWLALVAAPVILAQNLSNIANCTNSQYYWVIRLLSLLAQR